MPRQAGALDRESALVAALEQCDPNSFIGPGGRDGTIKIVSGEFNLGDVADVFMGLIGALEPQKSRHISPHE